MIGILALIALSYLLLRFTGNLHVLTAYLPASRSATDFLFGLFCAILYHCIFKFGLALLVANPYRPNPDYTVADCLNTLGYIFRSVVYEELIFRGALLWVLCRKLGAWRATLISSLSFGIYHWFAWQVIGNPVQMAIVLLTTGSAGLVYAYAFVRTKSMYLPISLHFGSNFATMLLFSKDQTIGPQLLVETYAHDPVVPPAVIGITMLVLHFIGFQCCMYVAIRRYSASTPT